MGSPRMNYWPGDECNIIRGTETSAFPPLQKRKASIWIFERGICRSLQTIYEKPALNSGLPISRHTADLGDLSVNQFILKFDTTKYFQRKKMYY